MASKKKSPLQYVPLEERPEFIAAVEALPADPAELELRAAHARQLYHDAMLAGDEQALGSASVVYRACVIKLNGGTHFGCSGIQKELEAKFAAPAGQVPGWGQAGEFLLEVEGMRIVVKMCPDSMSSHCGAELNAVDFDRPFLSRTGYRHQYMHATQHLGRTVDQAVRAEVLELLAGEGKAAAIDSEYRTKKDVKAWPWLADALAGVRPDGQLAMFGDAPKGPEAKAPLSNADRQRLFRQRQREKREALKAEGLHVVELSEVDRARLFIALDTHLSFDQLLDWDLEGYHELAARLFKGAVNAAAMLKQLGTSVGVANYKKRFEVDSKRGWKAYEEERNTSKKLRDKLSAAQVEIRQLQQALHDIAVEVSGAPAPIEIVAPVAVSPAGKALGVAELNREVAFLAGEINKATAEVDELRRQNAAQAKENKLLESERNKALGAIRTWEDRLRNAGLSTDYRAQPGE